MSRAKKLVLRFSDGVHPTKASGLFFWAWTGGPPERVPGSWMTRLFPQLDGAFRGVKSDVSEKVLSSLPQFGDDAACFERRRSIAQAVDDVIA